LETFVVQMRGRVAHHAMSTAATMWCYTSNDMDVASFLMKLRPHLLHRAIVPPAKKHKTIFIVGA